MKDQQGAWPNTRTRKDGMHTGSVPPVNGPRRGAAIVLALVASLMIAPHEPRQAFATTLTPESLIAYSSGVSGDFNIWLVDPDDPSSASQLTASQHEDYDPIWSQDGSRLAFWRVRRVDNTASLWVINRDGSGERQMLDWQARGGGSMAPAFWYTGDPSGERVYYIKDPGGSCQFLWIYADGSSSQTPRPVAGAESKCQPDLSPDQTKVALRDYGRVVVIEVGDLSPDGNTWTKTGEIVRTGQFSSEVSLPEWSPDGSRISFSVVGDGVWTAAPDGTNLTTVSAFGNGPTWSPDSSHLTFHANGDIYVSPSDGSASPTNITAANALGDLSPDWSPSLTGPLNEAPTADAGGPYLVPVGSDVGFDSSGSSDPDGDVLTETWLATGGTVLGDVYTAGTEPGIFDVCLTVNDGRVESDASCTFVVVYDPSAGFATGGGWFTPSGISSDPGDLLPGIDGTSKASFGFVVKYKNGAATAPGGNLEFHYNVGSFHLRSSGMEWLVVTNSNWTKFQGTATIDGLVGTYPFRVDARDSVVDRFVIKIYDVGADTSVDDPIYRASGDLGGGQIKIHN